MMILLKKVQVYFKLVNAYGKHGAGKHWRHVVKISKQLQGCNWLSKLRHTYHSEYLECINEAIVDGIVMVESDCQRLAGRQIACSSSGF